MGQRWSKYISTKYAMQAPGFHMCFFPQLFGHVISRKETPKNIRAPFAAPVPPPWNIGADPNKLRR